LLKQEPNAGSKYPSSGSREKEVSQRRLKVANVLSYIR